MSILKRVWRAWNRLWFEPIDARPLAAFRIAFGVYLLGYMLRYLPRVEVAFSSDGVYSPYLISDWALPPAAAKCAYALCLLVLAAFTAGLWTRLATLAAFLFFEYYYYLNFAVMNTDYDRLNGLLLFILCWTDSGAVWSIDAWRRQAVRRVSAWQIRLFKFQLSAVYLGTGLWKLFNPYWHTGEMLKSTMAGAWASPFSFWLLSFDWPMWFFTALTWSVIAFEIVAAFTLHFPKTRWPTIAIGTLFHVGNALLLHVPEFLNCVAMYALFIPYRSADPQPAQTDYERSKTPEMH